MPLIILYGIVGLILAVILVPGMYMSHGKPLKTPEGYEISEEWDIFWRGIGMLAFWPVILFYIVIKASVGRAKRRTE